MEARQALEPPLAEVRRACAGGIEELQDAETQLGEDGELACIHGLCDCQNVFSKCSTQAYVPYNYTLLLAPERLLVAPLSILTGSRITHMFYLVLLCSTFQLSF
jgi:hypothetical protein